MLNKVHFDIENTGVPGDLDPVESNAIECKFQCR